MRDQYNSQTAYLDDGITAEFLNADGKPVIKAFQRLFNSVIHEGQTLRAWNRSLVVPFFKNGDNAFRITPKDSQ